MKLHEYQAKQIFARYGVPIPKGKVVLDPKDIEANAKALIDETGTEIVVVKAQTSKSKQASLSNTVDVVSAIQEDLVRDAKDAHSRVVVRRPYPPPAPRPHLGLEPLLPSTRSPIPNISSWTYALLNASLLRAPAYTAQARRPGRGLL